MIKANELRIGNYHKGNCLDITRAGLHSVSINGEHFSAISAYGIYLVEHDKDVFNPIPLTAEWLERMDFYRFNADNSLIRDLADEEMYLNWHEGKMTLQGNGGYDENGELPLTHIRFVHQLQNLYFTLTGQELTLKA